MLTAQADAAALLLRFRFALSSGSFVGSLEVGGFVLVGGGGRATGTTAT